MEQGSKDTRYIDLKKTKQPFMTFPNSETPIYWSWCLSGIPQKRKTDEII